MTDTIFAWSQTAASNANADASINWAEFQNPDTVNDSARQMMKRVADLLASSAPKQTSTGTATAYVVTSPAAGATLRDGESVTFIPHLSNTTACTLQVAGRAAKPWRPKSGVEFGADNILAGVPVTAYYKLSTDEWISPGTGYYVTALASGVALQSITARLPQIGDLVVSYAPSPGPGRIRLGETTQSILKLSYPELNSYLSGISYPWGSTATHFNIPPAAGYFLRFAATSAAVDTGGARTAGSLQTDQNKTAAIPSTGLSASSASSSTSTVSGGTFGGSGSSSWGSDGGGLSGPTSPSSIVVSTTTTTTTTLSGSATLPGGDEVRTKNVAFHLDIVAATALSAAQVAVFGFPFQWDTGTANANPGAGRVRGNNTTLASVTTIYISKTDGWGVDLSVLLGALAKGNQIILSRVGAQANRIVATMTNPAVASTDYYQLPVSLTVAAGSFALNDQIAFEFGNPGINVTPGTVTTGAPGSSVAINITEPTQSNFVIDFTIPRGDTGASGTGAGNVVGPGSSAANAIAAFDGTTGTILKEAPAGSVGGSLLASDAVSTAKIANDAVTEVKIAAAAVTTGKIANDAVSYPKMQNASANVVITRAAGTAGDLGETALAASQLLGRGATGDIAPISLGSGLAMSGTSLSATVSPALVLIETKTLSNVATADFETGLDDTYDDYLFRFDLSPATDNATLFMRVKAGGSYQTTGYKCGVFGVTNNPAHASVSSTTALQVTFAGVGNASGRSCNGEINFSNPEVAKHVLFNWRSSGYRSDNFTETAIGCGCYDDTLAVTGIRFLFSTGNIASGRITLYGIKKS